MRNLAIFEIFNVIEKSSNCDGEINMHWIISITEPILHATNQVVDGSWCAWWQVAYHLLERALLIIILHC